MEFHLSNIKSDRQKEHLNQKDEKFFPEVKDAFEIINKFANDQCEENENDLMNALKQISNYLENIQKASNQPDFQFEPIIPTLIQIYLRLDDQSDKNTIFLELFHQITTLLPNSKIQKYFSDKELCDRLFNYISTHSLFSNISSRVISHLIISNTITDFYDVPDFLNIAPNISNLCDRAYFLYMLPEINIPSEHFFNFLQLAIVTFDIEEYETVEYCCQSICNCINDELENENHLPLEELNNLFEPFLLSFQSDGIPCIMNKKIVKYIIELFECLFDNNICVQFFSSNDFYELLYNSSVENLFSNADPDGEYFFEIIFPFLSDIITKNRLHVTQELFNNIVSIAMEGSFKVRKVAFLFISDVFDQIIMESPELFECQEFYELLIEMMSSNIDDIMSQIIECISKLLSSQNNFIQFIKESSDDYRNDFMTELDRIDDEMNDSDISRNIIYIKRTLRQYLPRPYESLDANE